MSVMQFTLLDMFAATTWVAFACLAATHAVGTGESIARLLAWFAVPILVCGAVGILRRRLRFWLQFALAIDLTITGLLILSKMA
jgi:membrane protein DedA with SNARE-associated domain